MSVIPDYKLGFFLFLSLVKGTHAGILDSKGRLRDEVNHVFRLTLPALTSKPSNSASFTKFLKEPKLSVEQMYSVAQGLFVIPQGVERNDPVAIAHYESLGKALSPGARDEVYLAFKKMGDIDTRYPAHQEFDYILVNGSFVSEMRARIAFLGESVESGKIKISQKTQIIFLKGERPLQDEEKKILLDPSPYRISPFWKTPTSLSQDSPSAHYDERDAAELVWNQLLLPDSLRKKDVLYIHAEKKPGSPRAQTEDCVLKWLTQFSPKPGRALVVSRNPFVGYQLLVTHLLFNKLKIKGFEFEGLGGPATFKNLSKDAQIGLLLDNLGRQLYYYQLSLK